MDFDRARRNMIDSQIRPGGVLDLRVIAAMGEVPRELFVPEQQRALAYVDEDLCIGTDAGGAKRWLLQPLTFARMLQLAEIDPRDCILDVGCASGYSTAVLARLAQSVIAVERDEALAARATANLEAQEALNAVVMRWEHARGFQREAPYDVIVLNGRIEEKPMRLLAQLKDLGRLVCVFGPPHAARIRLYTRRGRAISHADHHDCAAPPLPGFRVSDEVLAF